MAMEFGAGIAAGVLGDTATQMLQKKPDELAAEDWLHKIHDLVESADKYFKARPTTKQDYHETLLLNIARNMMIEYHDFLAIYFLCPVAATFTITVSGLQNFVLTVSAGAYPFIGLYNRWRYPPGTRITLITPVQTNFPIDLLYTDDTSGN